MLNIVAISFSIGIAIIFASFFVCKKLTYKNFNELSLNEIEKIYQTKEKFDYKKLKHSSLNEYIKILYSNIKKPMFTDKVLIDNKKYILTLSKFIDYKINNSKQTFRAKSNLILIEQIAAYLSKELIKSGECKIFFKFNQLKLQYNLRQKEIKVFKILLAKYIFEEIIKIENELIEVSDTIQKSKNAKHLNFYRKKLKNSANIYGIVKFNGNSNKLLANDDLNKEELLKNFFIELMEAEHRLKLSVTYLKVLFS